MPEAGIIPHVTLWIFDFDGTLSPLVADRTAAKLDPLCREMLCRLAAVEGFCCAILSSRHLADLESRVDVAGIYLGGSSGVEWKLPDGRRRVPEAEWQEKIRTARETMIPEIMEWSRLPGVEVEDKRWSVAIHTRRADQEARQQLLIRLGCWQKAQRVSVLRGPAVLEIQLIPEVNKAIGVRTFCGLVNCIPDSCNFRYAGDDENDAIAMRLVQDWGGRIFTIGKKAIVPGTDVVSSPRDLAKRINILEGFTNNPKAQNWVSSSDRLSPAAGVSSRHLQPLPRK
jgi:trehalose-phosphatase